MGFMPKYFSAEAGLSRAVKGAPGNPVGAIAGNMLNKTIGGAVIGAGANAAVYGNSGQSVDGAYSYGEAAVSGGMVGAALGGVIGVAGIKGAVATARAKRTVSDKRIAKAADRVINKKYDSRLQAGLGKDWKISKDVDIHNNVAAKMLAEGRSPEEIKVFMKDYRKRTVSEAAKDMRLGKAETEAIRDRLKTSHFVNPLKKVDTA